ncbi:MULTISPECIES: enterobactin synthase subunit F [Tenebrionibacter/Tenebrionicola group]|uniref:Enterobactin synthase subunit F n=2 Tax=Tenebrionibacter/Tenebrionicola group TaxID=2969848 RepID=A0A8K0XW49_9ENTR|nr:MULTISPECIES: enterobactin synthase subunit F [Tenebrionibacter/Tenebrionicola group]MBK4714706.1 enterobactin synthase subunit F [Tenebrionibacter intestinalis]MBV5095176.1 enterobactin synthase subunit F [Tenebrionicola larvae]
MSESEVVIPVAPGTALPLVAAQPGIWMADRLSAQANAWSVAHYVELNGEVDIARLSQAIVAGMNDVDTLRMRFTERDDGVPVQWVDASLTFSSPDMLDLRDAASPVSAALAHMRQDLEQDLRISSGKPLYHHALLRIGERRWYWYQRYHHIAVDGFSFTAITRHIASLYTALCRGEQPPASPFTPFSDVVKEYTHYQATPVWLRDAEFWHQQARELPPPASVSDKPLSGQGATTRLIRQSLTFDSGDFQRLTAHGQPQRLSAADMALALTSLWLGRLANRTQYAAGFIFMRRLGSTALCAAGPVLNVLPWAVRIPAQATLVELAAQQARQMKTLRRHQRYDAEQVQRDLGHVADGEPLFGPVINIKMFDYRLDFNGVNGITHQLASGPVRDLEIALYPGEQGELAMDVLANSERYEADALAKHISRLPRLLKQFADDPTLTCQQADLLHDDEVALINRVNATRKPLAAQTLSGIIAQQAKLTPDAPALADDSWQFSYRDMRQQVLLLAQQLKSRGVKPGDIVAVALPRSVFLSLALQAIVETGAAWLPLDTGYPDDRLRMMLEDAAPRLIITTDEQLARFTGVTNMAALCLTAPLAGRVSHEAEDLSRPAHTAYVIFTSGSTGRPKGVMVGQEAIVNRLLWMQNHYPLSADDVVLQKTPCSFDVSVWEFFWPLMAGARLVMAPPQAHRDPQALLQLFSRWKVTTTHFVPSMLAAFVAALADGRSAAGCVSLRRVFCSGEALPADLCRQWKRIVGTPLHNLYGPTEAAVDVSWYPAFGQHLAAVEGSSVPVGWPVWNTGLRILDGAMQPVPPGVAGDLYLTGVQLAQGYLSRPDLTASRFIADPVVPGARMYRTGDVARWLDNGAVEYLGRSDDQLKIRGQRIELGEIERAMQGLPDVAQSVAAACVLNDGAAGGGDARQLVGYLVSASGAELDATALRERLLAQLPAHMVPVALVQMDSFPLSANGKLDRKRLPRPQPAARPAGRAPLPGLETVIANAFTGLLGCEIRSAQDDFFALGGHSLLAMRLAAELRNRLRRPVTVGQVMVASTVAGLAAALEQQDETSVNRAGFEAVLPLRRSEGPTLWCFHPASGFAWQFSVLTRWLDPRWSVMGLQSPRPEGPMQQAKNLAQVADSHLATLRERQPHGPYYLMGYSLGGTLAQAVAARLCEAGEEVAFLGLLDTWPPETQNWQEKGANALEPAVLAEIAREREAFLAAQQEMGSDALFSAIEGNYGDAVRLLSTARSVRFAGKATLFVAERTMMPGLSPRDAWAAWTQALDIYPVDCAHVDIIAPQAFTTIGPVLQRLLALR